MVSKLDDLHLGNVVARNRVKPLKVLHVIPSISAKHGGPSYAVESIARGSQEKGNEVVIATTDDDGDGARLSVRLGVLVDQGGIAHLFFRRDLVPYKISFGLSRWLDQHVTDFDVVHIHALFSFSSTMAARAARKHGIPYVVRPLGVLNRWGMENRRRFIKAASFRMIENRILKNAAAIHYTSRSEQQEAELCGGSVAAVRSVVIPLPLPERLASDPERFFQRFPAARGKQIVLFLSRIHPKKGIELLLEAFAQIHQKHPSAILVIAGEGEGKYTSSLEDRATELKISGATIWTGHLSGDDKWAAYDAATVYVLPSLSENFGVAAAESLASGVPTVITNEVGIAEEVEAAKAGIVVKTTAEGIAAAIELLLKDPERRRSLAQAGRQFAAARFSPNSIARALNELYEEILGSGRPAKL